MLPTAQPPPSLTHPPTCGHHLAADRLSSSCSALHNTSSPAACSGGAQHGPILHFKSTKTPKFWLQLYKDKGRWYPTVIKKHNR